VAAKFDSKSKFKWIQIIFKFVQTLTAPKRTFSGSNFFKIKYDCEGVEERNNFLHRNIFRFKNGFGAKKLGKQCLIWALEN
jgi:hypothetical protein